MDWLLIAGERHLWRVLAKYIEHSNLARAHRSLGLRAPLAGEEAGQPIGEVVCRSRLGGLLNELLAAGGVILARDFLYPTPF